MKEYKLQPLAAELTFKINLKKFHFKNFEFFVYSYIQMIYNIDGNLAFGDDWFD